MHYLLSQKLTKIIILLFSLVISNFIRAYLAKYIINNSIQIATLKTETLTLKDSTFHFKKDNAIHQIRLLKQPVCLYQSVEIAEFKDAYYETLAESTVPTLVATFERLHSPFDWVNF